MNVINKIPGPLLIFMGALSLSFGGLIVKKFEGSTEWQILFWRSLFFTLTVLAFLIITYKKKTLSSFHKSGLPGFFGGIVLSFGFCGYVYAMSNTSVANTNFIISLQILFLAIFGYLFLKEKISLNVWIAIIIATIGIIIIAIGNSEKNSLLGLIFGMTSSIGFSVFSVTLRWKKETPKFTTVAFAGLFCFVVATIVILTNDMVFLSTSYNGALFSLHGTLVCMGLILYSIGSKAIPAAELTLLSLTEVIGGIFLGMDSNFRN